MIDIIYNQRYNTIPTSAEKLDGNTFKTLCVMIRLWKEYAYLDGEHKGWFYHSIQEIMEATGLSNKTVDKCIDKLVEEKYLSKKHDKWQDRKSNWYQLHESLWEEVQPQSKPYGEIKCDSEVISEYCV